MAPTTFTAPTRLQVLRGAQLSDRAPLDDGGVINKSVGHAQLRHQLVEH
jgi:hypothetical protein